MVNSPLPTQTQPPRQRLPVLVVGAQALLVAALAAWLAVLHRDLGWPGEWVIQTARHLHPLGRMVPAVLVLTGFAGLVGYLWFVLRHEKSARARVGLGWTIAVALSVGAWWLQLALAAIVPNTMVVAAAIQLSDVSTGYVGEAYRIDDLHRYLRGYAAEMRGKPEHIATHPPGSVLFFYAVRQLGEAYPGLNEAVLSASGVGEVPQEQLRALIELYPTAIWRGQAALATAILGSWLLGALGALSPLVVFAGLHPTAGRSEPWRRRPCSRWHRACSSTLRCWTS